MATSDVERAVNALVAKQDRIRMLWQYYDGDHPVVYTNERLREIFRNVDARFTANWCAVVVDALFNRVQLGGFDVDEASANVEIDALWSELDLALEADDVHVGALVTGESYLCAWRDDAGEIEAYYNDPRLIQVFYDPENPRRKSWAAKWWDDEEGKRRLTLYYPDRLEYYVSTKKASGISSGKSFVEYEPAQANPYGVMPVFHFRTERRVLKSELANVIPVQNGINKLMIDMMVAAEYGAFKQRYIISSMDTPGKLKNAPNEIWDLAAGDGQSQPTSVGEFSATDLDNYLGAIDKLAQYIGVISHTPKHYFFAQGGDPSGEALIAMEAALNKKAQDRIDRFVPVWRQVAAFLLQLSGQQVASHDIKVNFAKPETVQPRTDAEIKGLRWNAAKAAVDSGLPLETYLRREEGWDDKDLAEMGTQLMAQIQAAQADVVPTSTPTGAPR